MADGTNGPEINPSNEPAVENPIAGVDLKEAIVSYDLSDEKIKESWEKASRYIIDYRTSGFDGTPLPQDALAPAAESLDREVNAREKDILVKNAKGEPVDAKAAFDTLVLSDMSDIFKGVSFDPEAFKAAIDNPANQLKFRRYFYPDSRKITPEGYLNKQVDGGGFDAWTKMTDPKKYAILGDGEALPTVDEAEKKVRQAREALAQEVPTGNKDNAPQPPSGNNQ